MEHIQENGTVYVTNFEWIVKISKSTSKEHVKWNGTIDTTIEGPIFLFRIFS
jgi:hypothetical protein